MGKNRTTTTISSRAIALTLVSTILRSALADFHLATVVQYPFQTEVGMTIDLGACPSNYYNCDCFFNAGFSSGRAGYTGVTDPGVPPSFFNIAGDGGGNFCGEKSLNFYQQDGQNVWQGYIAGGDGSVVATCYAGEHFGSWGGPEDLHCSNINGVASVFDQLVCYSYICGSA